MLPTRSTICGSMTWLYVTPSRKYSRHFMMLILFEHSPQRGLRKGIYLLILFSTILTDYVSSLLFQIVLLSTKWRASLILIFDYLYILCHINLRSKFFPGSIKYLAPPLHSHSFTKPNQRFDTTYRRVHESVKSNNKPILHNHKRETSHLHQKP